MTNDQFNQVLEARLIKIREVLGAKAAEYAVGNDRLSNFRRAAGMRNSSMAEACWWFLTKHLVSIQDMVESGRDFPQGQWSEKLGDAINYLILLEAITHKERLVQS